MAKCVLILVFVAGAGLVVPLASADQNPSSDASAAMVPITPISEPPDPTPPAQAHANQVSEDILDLVSGRPGFGGLWVDKAGVTHVGVTPAEAGQFKSALSDRFAGEFVLEQRGATYRDLEARRDRVTHMLPELKAAGLDLLEWGPDEVNGTLWVSLRQYSAEKAAAVRRLLGADVVVKQALATGDSSELFSRTDDSPPWSAGIYLYPSATTPYPQCTSGMPIVINRSRYLVTAGHCHDPALQGTFPQDVYNGGAKIGTANWADFTQNGVDAAIISGTAGFLLYRGPNTLVGVESVPWNSLVGQTVCAGGAFTGERCTLPVIAANYCSSYYPNRITCGVSTAGASGAEAAGHGDSGGPMYIVSPRSRISGIIVAAASPQFTCTTQGPVVTTRRCADYVRFQSASSILSHWNTTM